jgi:S-DNA-T family DNA segregation ATPase FtsK/SpoIIIE
LSPRVSAAFGERLVGALADRADFGLAGIAARDVPEQLPPGRGVRCRDGAEYQLGFPGSSASRDESHRVVAALAAHPRTVADHPLVAPIVIRPLPLDVRLDELAPVPGQVLLGVGGDAAEPVAVHLTAGSTLLVAGPPRSGRTTVLRSLLAQLDPARTQVAAPARSPLAAEAAAAGATLLGSVDDLIEAGAGPTTVLMDNLERFEDSPLAERLAARVREGADGLIVVASARSDEIATAYRGIGAALRRNRCGLLLRPGPVDGDVLGLRLPRHHEVVPPGRGLLVGDPAWGQRFTTGAPIQLQVARP